MVAVWLRAVAVAVMALSVCACGGADEDETEPMPTEPIAGIVSVTLRDGSCTLDGPRTVSDGHLIVELLRDDDEEEGSFELLRLAAGVTFEALEEHVEREEDRLESGRRTLGYQAFASLEASAELIEPDRQAVLDPQPQDLEPGEHAVLCIQLPKLDVVGPLTVVP